MPTDFKEFRVANPVRGWLPDLPTHKLNPESWITAKNVRFYNGRVERARYWRAQGNSVDNSRPVQFIGRARFQDGDDIPIVASDRTIYTVGTGGALTPLNATPFSDNTQARWLADAFPDANFFNRTDGTIKCQKYNGTTLAAVDDAGFGTFYGTLPTAKYLSQYKSHLVLGCLTNDGSGNIDLQSVAASDLADGGTPENPGSGESDWQYTDAASEAVIIDFFEGNDAVQAMLRLGDYLAVYKETSIHLMSYISGDFIYVRQQPVAFMGTPYPHSVVGSRGWHYFVGQDNIYRFNGAQLEPIGNGIYNTFLNVVAPDNVLGLWAFDDVLRTEIVWAGRDELALVYNYENGAFSLKHWPFNSAGYVNLALSGGGDWSDQSQAWDQWLDDWRETTFLQNLSILGGKTDGSLHVLHEANTFGTGFANESVLETVDLSFGTTEGLKMCNRMRVECSYSGATPLQVYVSVRDNLEDDIVYFGPYNITNGWVGFAHTGRWFRFKFVKSDGDFILSSYTIFHKYRGGRWRK